MAVETILVAVGPRDHERVERLAEGTVDIAGPTGANVVIARAFPEGNYDEVRSNLNLDDASVDEVAAHDATIRNLTDVLSAADVDHEVRGRVGDPGETMVELARGTGADIVVVGGRERSPAGKAVFGSVAQSILLSAPCPVLYVRTGTEG